MANINADVLRVFDTAANIPTTLRNRQFGFDTTNERIAIKDNSGTMHYFDKLTDANPTDITLTDNISDAFRVRESTNDYINISTLNGSEAINFGTAGTDALIIDGSQNVHIGSLGESYYLGSTPNTLNFGYGQDTDDYGGWVNYVGYAGSTTRYRDFFIGDGKQNKVLTVLGEEGYVGIGTGTPSQLLEVSDSSQSQISITSVAGDEWNLISDASSNFRLYSTAGAANRLVVDSGGNVTSGKIIVQTTTDESLKLESTDSGTPANFIGLYDTGGRTASIGMDSNGNDDFVIQNETATGTVTILTNSTNAIVVDTSQQSGFGVDSPTSRVQVEGTIRQSESTFVHAGTNLPSTIFAEFKEDTTGSGGLVITGVTDSDSVAAITINAYADHGEGAASAMIIDTLASAGESMLLLQENGTTIFSFLENGRLGLASTYSDPTIAFDGPTNTGFIIFDDSEDTIRIQADLEIYENTADCILKFTSGSNTATFTWDDSESEMLLDAPFQAEDVVSEKRMATEEVSQTITADNTQLLNASDASFLYVTTSTSSGATNYTVGIEAGIDGQQLYVVAETSTPSKFEIKSTVPSSASIALGGANTALALENGEHAMFRWETSLSRWALQYTTGSLS